MAPTTYAAVLVRNIRAARSRLGVNQADVTARMRALGYETWHRQTMGKVERGERRVNAEEILALAISLETTVERLMLPLWEDEPVEFPSGISLPQASVRVAISGPDPGMDAFSSVKQDHAVSRGIRWQGNALTRVTTPYDAAAGKDGET